MIRIVYIIGSLAKRGGAERVLVNKANFLADNYAYDVHIVVENQGKASICYDLSERITFHDLAINAKLPKKQLPIIGFFNNIKTLKPVFEKKLQAINPNIVLVLERSYADFIIPTILSLVPKVRESHSSAEAVKIMSSNKSILINFKDKFFTYLYNKQMKKYDFVVLLTNSDKVTRNYLKNTIVIPNITSNFSKKALDNQTFRRVISIGRLDKYKNHKDQILIWKNIVKKYPDWTLHIYGEGNNKLFLQNLIKELELENHVFLEGTTNDVASVYASASFFLFTSLAEGFGLVLVEAMQFSLPVVSYDAPCGPSDIISHKKDGFLIPVSALQALESACLELIENPEKRQEMGVQALQKSKAFLPEIIMKKWNEFFKQITHA